MHRCAECFAFESSVELPALCFPWPPLLMVAHWDVVRRSGSPRLSPARSAPSSPITWSFPCSCCGPVAMTTRAAWRRCWKRVRQSLRCGTKYRAWFQVSVVAQHLHSGWAGLVVGYTEFSTLCGMVSFQVCSFQFCGELVIDLFVIAWVYAQGL